MNNIQEADFLATFPPALKQDEKFVALGRLIADELHITANEVQKNIIYADIDNLSETWLDVLAYDLHIDWYDYDYPIEAKRDIVRDSVRVHQKLGTKAAVERALGGIHPKSRIEEWFDYGGQPYRFRIVLDTTDSRVEVDYDEIVKTVDIYKRLTAHLDGLFYQCSTDITILTGTEYYLFRTPMTGQLNAGTYPRRNREGVVHDTVIAINELALGYLIESDLTGTKPYRNIEFGSSDMQIVTDSDTNNYQFISELTGRTTAGTTPYRNMEGGVYNAGVNANAKATAYKFLSDMTGTKPDRNTVFGSADVSADTQAQITAYVFESTLTGTEPYTSVQAVREEKGIKPTAKTDTFQYEVKRCGRVGLSK